MRFARTRRIQLSPIKEVELAAARLPGVVSLAQGIPSFDTPQVIKDYVKRKLDEGAVAKYSLAPGLLELRQQVAQSLAAEGMRYDPEGEILITAGSIEGIAATLMAITEPGDEVLLPSPSYASYQQVIRLVGCEPKFVPLDEERNFDLDVSAIAKRITARTAAIIICNPNNPTGTLYTREQSLRMMELAERHDLMIVTDEVYKDFLFSGQECFTPAQEPAFRQRVVRIFSLSKAFAMTGWRVGYLHSDRRVVSEILKVHDSLVTCAPVISQYAAVAALSLGQDAVAEFRAAYKRRRDLTLRHLDALSHIFDYQKPTGSYFVFPRVKDTVPLAHDSRALALDLLERAKVAVVPGIAFGPTGEQHLRLSFSRDDADIQEAFARLGRYFTDRAHAPRFASAAARAMAPSASSAIESGSIAGVSAAPAGAPQSMLRAAAVGYLHALARLYLWRRRPLVIAVAGNRGKTVLKRTLWDLLAPHFSIRANPRSYNTEVGLPLAVLGLEIDPKRPLAVALAVLRATARAALGRPAARMLVLELGARRAGDMAQLLGIVRPEWAIITPLSGRSDAAGMGEPQPTPSEARTLQEEMRVLARQVPPAHLLVAADDPLLAPLLEGSLGSEQPGPAVAIARAALQARPGGYRYHGLLGDYDLGPELVGASAFFAAQAAIALGERLGLPAQAIQAFLNQHTGLVETAVEIPPPPSPGLALPAAG